MGSVWSFGERWKYGLTKKNILFARVHETIIIQQNQVHQPLFTLRDFLNVILPSDDNKKEISPGTTQGVQECC